jgi:hypothetical protein
MIDARGHAKAVEFDLMEPSRSGRRLLDRLGKLRRNEAGKGRASAGPTGLDGRRSRTVNDTRHAGSPTRRKVSSLNASMPQQVSPSVWR